MSTWIVSVSVGVDTRDAATDDLVEVARTGANTLFDLLAANEAVVEVLSVDGERGWNVDPQTGTVAALPRG